ncbi:hypothetical protein C8Q79DRAFT_900791 [Trametes meyenii]|nr:hypothetical protein C8Q79DRAFT_900791 [Trametes meyenii]
MDSNDVGRFGTLSLLRRLPVESVVTSYPIDDEELTIGRDQSCSLRLYYPAVSALHAKITFVDRKAFLVVLGTNGIMLDDSPLFPAASNAPGPTTVPLQNSSVIEIHKKRFRFNYPPKHLRPALINTPSRATPSATRRPLRLSMIASAHVFTPGPSHDPQQNLRVLQSPLRTPFASEQEEIVLVHSNTPRVVEEDKDLVILDEVEPEPAPVFPLPLPPSHQVPQTPVRRAPRPSLHRAVLIRSAQRAAIQREIQVEEEQDAEEVEETIAAIAEAEEDEDVQEVPPPEGQRQVTGWRKSLDVVKGSLGWAFRGLSVEPKEEEDEAVLENGDDEVRQYDGEEDEQMEGDNHDGYEDYADENYDDNAYDDDPEDDPEEETASVRPLGRFMTPQLPRTFSAREARLSLGGGPDAGPRRVRVVAPWKVSEIQVPTAVKEEDTSGSQTNGGPPPSTPRSPTKREKLSEEEREAIRARRRSALATPDNFFKGQTPGSRRTLFPSLAPLPSPSFTQPSEAPSELPSSRSASIKEETPTAAAVPKKEEDDEKEDTAVLLARMKQMVEGVKQRQSLGRQSLNLSPRKREGGFSLLAPGHATAHAPSRILIEEDEHNADETHHNADAPSLGSATDASTHVAPQTPRMSDLRHVFGRAHAEPSTPALAGVRDMFRSQPQGPVATPQMDGVREMLGTPAGYRAASPGQHVPAHEPPVVVESSGHDIAQEAEEMDEHVQPLATRGARGRKAPGASRIARRAPVPAPQSAPAKSTRASSQALEEQNPIEGGEETGRVVRRTRARTADGEVGQPSRPARGKVVDKKPATPEPHDEDEHPSAPATAARATRRTRQPTESSTSSHTDDTTDTKPARKTRAKTPTTVTKAAPTRRGTRAKPIEVTEEDHGNDDHDSDGADPLDSLPHDPPPAARARRGTRSKIPVGAVKQEDIEPSLPAEPVAGTRTTRARRTPVPRQPTPSGTAPRGGSRSKAGAVVEAAIPENKENTPEPNEGDEEGEGQDDSKAPAARVRAAGKSTRKTGKAAAAAASEEASATAAPATKTRTGRARATRAPSPCGEMNRLPKITQGIKSVNFRRTTPGSIRRMVYANKPPPPSAVVDPNHPALAYAPHEFIRTFPWRSFPGFKLRVLPKGLLDAPTSRYPDPPYTLNEGPTKGRSVNMSLLDVAPKSVGGRVVRQDILRKFKTAISLIVTRGADVEGPEGQKRVVFRDVNDAESWILPNWTYVIRPEHEVYSMPYKRLIPLLRDFLQLTAVTGRRLERDWEKAKQVAPIRNSSLRQGPAVRPLPRANMPSVAPPGFSKEEKKVQTTLLQALQHLSGPTQAEDGGEGRQDEDDIPSRPEPVDEGPVSQKPTLLDELMGKYSRRHAAVRSRSYMPACRKMYSYDKFTGCRPIG